MEIKNQIINGNCIEIMKDIPDNTIAGCVTDPPYNYEFIGKEWNHEEIQRRVEKAKNSKNVLVKNIPYGSGLSGGVRNARWYKKNRENMVNYAEWCEEWGAELYRILKPGGMALIFNSSRSAAQVQVAMENVGFYPRDMMIWRRSTGIPKGLNISKKLEKEGNPKSENWVAWHSALRNEFESIVVVQKPLENNYINTLKKYNVGVFKAKSEEGFKSNIIENIQRDKKADFNIHVTVKPLSLIKDLVELIIPKDDGNIVIDPFLGSGTTAVAAKLLGINYLGIEINPDYIEIAKTRLEDLPDTQLGLF